MKDKDKVKKWMKCFIGVKKILQFNVVKRKGTTATFASREGVSTDFSSTCFSTAIVKCALKSGKLQI